MKSLPTYLVFAFFLAATSMSSAADSTLKLTKRSRAESAEKKGDYTVVAAAEEWNPKESVIIVCDVWDAHHCLNAVRREEEMVPRMNELIEKCRAMGVLIIHAPSGCMAPYKDHAGRKLAMSAPKAAKPSKVVRHRASPPPTSTASQTSNRNRRRAEAKALALEEQVVETV